MTYSEAGKLGAKASIITCRKKKKDNIEKYNKNPIRCLVCNECIPYSKRLINKFCSSRCYYDSGSICYNNRKRKIIHYCLNCNRETNGSKFCPHNECHREYTYKEYIKRWKLGNENGIIGKGAINNYLKRYLKEKYNNKCSKCGWNKVNNYSNKIPLEAEHKDGNYKNNKEYNLDLLCPNCHSLTKTYKGLNRGHGRKYRKGL